MKVHVAFVDAPDGTFFLTSDTEKGLTEKLFSYVCVQWAEEKIAERLPDDHAQAVRDFFLLCEDYYLYSDQQEIT